MYKNHKLRFHSIEKLPRYHHLHTNAINTAVCVLDVRLGPRYFFILFFREQSSLNLFNSRPPSHSPRLSSSSSMMFSHPRSLIRGCSVSLLSLQKVCKTHLLYQAGTSSSKKSVFFIFYKLKKKIILRL